MLLSQHQCQVVIWEWHKSSDPHFYSKPPNLRQHLHYFEQRTLSAHGQVAHGRIKKKEEVAVDGSQIKEGRQLHCCLRHVVVLNLTRCPGSGSQKHFAQNRRRGVDARSQRQPYYLDSVPHANLNNCSF